MMLIRVPVAPVVALPSDGPALEPVTVRHAGPAVAGWFEALKRPAAAERVRNSVQRIEVHEVRLPKRRR